jgi:hypothetical protein
MVHGLQDLCDDEAVKYCLGIRAAQSQCFRVVAGVIYEPAVVFISVIKASVWMHFTLIIQYMFRSFDHKQVYSYINVLHKINPL